MKSSGKVDQPVPLLCTLESIAKSMCKRTVDTLDGLSFTSFKYGFSSARIRSLHKCPGVGEGARICIPCAYFLVKNRSSNNIVAKDI